MLHGERGGGGGGEWSEEGVHALLITVGTVQSFV